MRVLAIVTSIITIVLTVLAGIGYIIFVGGWSGFNSETAYFLWIDQLPQATQEAITTLFHSHYTAALFSPILFIAMIVMSVLMMVLKNKWATYVIAILSIPITILVAFVMASAGAILFLYGLVITYFRLNLAVPFFSTLSNLDDVLGTINTMFAGILLEVLFLTGALVAMFFGAIMAGKGQKNAEV